MIHHGPHVYLYLDRKLDAAAAFQSMMMMQYQNLSHVVGDEPDFMVRVQGSFFRTKNNVIYEKICQPSGGSSSAFVPFTMASADSTHMGCNVAGPDMNGAHWMTVIFAISDGSELGAEYSADPNLSLQDAASVATNNMQEMLQAQLKQQLEASLSKAMSQGSSMLPPGFQSIPSTGQAMPIAPNNGQPSSNNNFGASFFTNPQPMTFQPLIFH